MNESDAKFCAWIAFACGVAAFIVLSIAALADELCQSGIAHFC